MAIVEAHIAKLEHRETEKDDLNQVLKENSGFLAPNMKKVPAIGDFLHIRYVGQLVYCVTTNLITLFAPAALIFSR